MNKEEFVDLSIGVPFLDHGEDFSGWDCLGLVKKAHKELFNTNIIVQDYASANSLEGNSELLENNYTKYWERIPFGKEEFGDVVVLRYGRWACHLGLVISRGKMLHVDEKFSTYIESYINITWKNRVVGIYRYGKFTN